MNPPLSPVGVRILGALIEKETTTPESYPLTLNALVAACNQTSSREPVMTLDETTVQKGLDELRTRALVRGASGIGSRTLRYSHLAGDTLDLDRAQRAVMCILMLRGPQTVGEIRTRGARLYEFTDLEQTEGVLNGLASREPAFVAHLPRQPGQKEARYAHLLSGEVAAVAEGRSFKPAPDTAASTDTPESRIAALEQTVETLQKEVAELRDELRSLKG